MSLLIDELDPAARRARFRRLAAESARSRHVQGLAGFGTLQEKRLHAVVKSYLCENTDYHEVGVLNTRYVADVRVGNEIYEVQTGSFYPLKEKIAYYLDHTDCSVTVVHPLAVERTVSWVDPNDGSVTPPRKIAYRSRPEELLAELYPLLPYLSSPRLSFRLLLLSVEDYRLLNGWSADRKRGSRRYERVPVDLLDDLCFSSPADFRRFLPETLPSPFTVRQFSNATRVRGRDAYSSVRVLTALGLVRPAPPVGRVMAFERVME